MIWPFKKAIKTINIPAPDSGTAVRLQREEMLFRGEWSAGPLTNVAYGSPGYAAYSLLRDGYFRTWTVDGVLPGDCVKHFKITPEGEAERERLLSPSVK